jgi:hypothetical protein
MKNFLLLLAFCLGGIALQAQSVSFTLRNNSLSSIPLKIPGVMNPNLSPMSNSGVSLEVGQKIYFQHRGRKKLLLEVTTDLEGTKVIVNEEIKRRKEELDLE